MLYFSDTVFVRFRQKSQSTYGLSYELFIIGLEVKLRSDDSSMGFYLVNQYRNSFNLGQIAFFPSSQFEKPMFDNLWFMYDGEWRVDYSVDYR